MDRNDFRPLIELLQRWQSAIQLSAARTQEDLAHHIRDSRACLPHLPTGATTLIDVGSGGGFPGLVLAMERSDLEVTLLEPIRKKSAFLNTARRELGLNNVTVLPMRDDDFAESGDFRLHDVGVSRATWALPVWLDRARRLVDKGGLILGMEGREQHELPPGAERHPYDVPGKTRAIITYTGFETHGDAPNF